MHHVIRHVPRPLRSNISVKMVQRPPLWLQYRPGLLEEPGARPDSHAYNERCVWDHKRRKA